ncbi:MAG TPA: hypothetical protein VGW40_05695 [Allosphingosinicella sp.]|nr:hypothetical protein [Allosphingosinicella sp.]
MRLFLAIAMLAPALAGAACPRTGEVNERRSTDLPRPRDGNVAVQEELDAARRAGKVEAYDLFIARNPNHPLAAVARRERARLRAPRT